MLRACAQVGIRSFRVAGVLLMGLLFYDIFWVFGSPRCAALARCTGQRHAPALKSSLAQPRPRCVCACSVVGDNVMLDVATSDLITGPNRLLFPRSMGGVGEVGVVHAAHACGCTKERTCCRAPCTRMPQSCRLQAAAACACRQPITHSAC